MYDIFAWIEINGLDARNVRNKHSCISLCIILCIILQQNRDKLSIGAKYLTNKEKILKNKHTDKKNKQKKIRVM